MAQLIDEEDCSRLNVLHRANSRALNELMLYVNKTDDTDAARYRLLLADSERTWAEFVAFAQQFLRPH